ncbi:hypothetical protein J6590_043084 [Homalodisca vitripennis]|nr:hypothetical protein J6590_043084 [Homalodisca vitripennis]
MVDTARSGVVDDRPEFAKTKRLRTLTLHHLGLMEALMKAKMESSGDGRHLVTINLTCLTHTSPTPSDLAYFQLKDLYFMLKVDKPVTGSACEAGRAIYETLVENRVTTSNTFNTTSLDPRGLQESYRMPTSEVLSGRDLRLYNHFLLCYGGTGCSCDRPISRQSFPTYLSPITDTDHYRARHNCNATTIFHFSPRIHRHFRCNWPNRFDNLFPWPQKKTLSLDFVMAEVVTIPAYPPSWKASQQHWSRLKVKQTCQLHGSQAWRLDESNSTN